MHHNSGKKVAFLAPRFHTNQLSLIDFLVENNHTVVFYVTTFGFSEDHSTIAPTIVNPSALNRLINFIARKKTNNLKFDYKIFIPSLKSLLEYVKFSPNLLIIRDPYSVIGIVYAVVSKIFGIRVVFYTQRDVHREAVRKDAIARLLIKFFKAYWISPCLGDIKYNSISENMLYIPFCMEVVQRKEDWFDGGYVNIVCVGKFFPRKNHHLLIEALEMLSSAHKIRLRIIGEVSDVTGDAYFNKIKKMVSSVSYEIDLLTNLKRNEVFEQYRVSDIFVLPSKDEPASVSNLEAMACGLPVITTDSNKTSCYTRGNGFIVKTDSVDDLMKKIKIMLDDRELIKKMGVESIRLVETMHNSSLVYEEMMGKFLDE